MPTTVAPTRSLIARVALGGLVGSAIRVAAGAVIPDSTFPWDTVAVNLLGAFVIALLVPRLRGHRDRLALVVFGIGGPPPPSPPWCWMPPPSPTPDGSGLPPDTWP